MKTAYKVTLLKQLNALMYFILLHISFFTLYSYAFEINFSDPVFLVPLGTILLVSTLPTLALHINYVIVNYRSTLTIDLVNSTGNFTSGNTSKLFKFNDIKFIEYFSSFGKGSGVYTFQHYRYCRIVLTEGDEFFITNLMMLDMESNVPLIFKHELKKKYTLLCFTFNVLPPLKKVV